MNKDQAIDSVCQWCGDDEDRWKSFLDHLNHRRDRNYYFSIIAVAKLLYRSSPAEINRALTKAQDANPTR